MHAPSATARVILGFLNRGPKSGYEIKSKVDNSTRFFWAASYGQIYPELKRLEEAGLVEGVADPQGGRQRTVYSLTEAGREVLREWLTSPAELMYELRDEGLLKFFFADALTLEEQLEVVRRMRARHERTLERFAEIEPRVREVGGFPYRTLRYGAAQHRWIVGWCCEMERELAGAESAAGAGDRSD
jgi:PadR family transcriptional regulator AphA